MTITKGTDAIKKGIEYNTFLVSQGLRGKELQMYPKMLGLTTIDIKELLGDAHIVTRNKIFYNN